METSTEPRTASKYGRVRRDVENINERVEALDRKVGVMDDGYTPLTGRVGYVEDNMYSNSNKIDNLEQSNRVNSAKLELIQKELKHMKLQNEILEEQLTPRGQDTSREVPRDSYYSEHSRPEPEPWREEPPTNWIPDKARTPSRVARDDDRDLREREKYLAENERYKNNPEVLETSRREKAKGNRWNLDEIRQKEQKQKYSFYDTTTINSGMWEEGPEHKRYPWFDHEKMPAGGFGFIRFHDDGHELVSIALKSLQSIIRNCGGYIQGIAGKETVHVYDCVPSSEWVRVRDQDSPDYMKVANGVAVLWFTDAKASELFFQNSKNNRFRDTAFPTAHGHESFYVPILETLPQQKYRTFLFIEFLRGRQYKGDDRPRFEAELRQDMEQMVPNCHPLVVSSLGGRDYYRPGPFVSAYSWLLVSGFMAPADADYYLKAGRLHQLKKKWNLNDEMCVFKFTISDC